MTRSGWPAPASATRRALRVDVERIDRLARRHEQAVAATAAEADVGAALRQLDAADEGAVAVVDHHAVELVGAHAPAAPEVPVDVDAEAVRGARAGVDEHALVLELPPVHVEGEDQPVRRRARLDEVEDRLVGREGEAIGAADI